MATPLLDSKSVVMMCPEPSASCPVPASIPFVTCVTSHSSGVWTIVSAQLSAANDFSYGGMLLIALDGNCAGEIVLIREFVNGTDTATIDPLSRTSPPTTQYAVFE